MSYIYLYRMFNMNACKLYYHRFVVNYKSFYRLKEVNVNEVKLNEVVSWRRSSS